MIFLISPKFVGKIRTPDSHNSHLIYQPMNSIHNYVVYGTQYLCVMFFKGVIL